MDSVEPYIGWDVFLAFDSEVFRLTGASPGELFGEAGEFDFFFEEEAGGMFFVGFAFEEPFPAESGTLFSLNVSVQPDAPPGVYEWDFSEPAMFGLDFDFLEIEGAGSSIFVVAP